MTPIEELRRHLGRTVKVRVLNTLTWAGIQYVEEIVGWSDREIMNLSSIAREKGHVYCNMGWKSRTSLAKAIDKVMAGKVKGMTIKLENFLTGISIKETCLDDDESAEKFILEFSIRVADFDVKFQSYPMTHDKALRLNTTINSWALEYNKIRSQVGILHDALNGMDDVLHKAKKRLR